MKIEQLNTEIRNKATVDIDRPDTYNILWKINSEDLKVAAVVKDNL